MTRSNAAALSDTVLIRKTDAATDELTSDAMHTHQRRRPSVAQPVARRPRVVGIEQQRSLIGDPGAAGDLRDDRRLAGELGLLRNPSRKTGFR